MPCSTPPFKRGDVVRLKSGSPKMTVDRIAGDSPSVELCPTYINHPITGDRCVRDASLSITYTADVVEVVWFSADHSTLSRSVFPVASLELVTPSPYGE